MEAHIDIVGMGFTSSNWTPVTAEFALEFRMKVYECCIKLHPPIPSAKNLTQKLHLLKISVIKYKEILDNDFWYN